MRNITYIIKLKKKSNKINNQSASLAIFVNFLFNYKHTHKKKLDFAAQLTSKII